MKFSDKVFFFKCLYFCLQSKYFVKINYNQGVLYNIEKY